MDNMTLLLVVAGVAFVLGWHLFPRPQWVSNVIDWYHHELGSLKAWEQNLAHWNVQATPALNPTPAVTPVAAVVPVPTEAPAPVNAQ
jgi:hypothetical protein